MVGKEAIKREQSSFYFLTVKQKKDNDVLM